MAESTPSPKAILRGHKAQVHAATFVRQNERLATGDAEGWVVLWDLTIMRPRAVWRAHENAILGIRGWGSDKIITYVLRTQCSTRWKLLLTKDSSHGRDHKLIVWRVKEEDEERLSVSLPLEDTPTPRPQPWVLHLLEVNTMNFCSFAACLGDSKQGRSIEASSSAAEVILAVPNTLASEAVSSRTISDDDDGEPGSFQLTILRSTSTHYQARTGFTPSNPANRMAWP